MEGTQSRDIRFIQAMLGHVKLDTTQIYTQVSSKKLKEIHTATHPVRSGRTARVSGDLAGDDGVDSPTLFVDLAAEADLAERRQED